jgi:hypothetical protein
MSLKLKPEECIGTHFAGYMSGSYWDGYDIVCGLCGARIINPFPTSGKSIYYRFWENPFKWFRKEVKDFIPQWPNHILGVRGEKYDNEQEQTKEFEAVQGING